MRARYFCGYSFLVLFLILPSLFSQAKSQKPYLNKQKVWVLGLPHSGKTTFVHSFSKIFSDHFDEGDRAQKKIPHFLSVNNSHSSFVLIEMPSFQELKKTHSMKDLPYQIKRKDSVLFLMSSTTLVHRPYEIIDELYGLLFFLGENKVKDILPHVTFLVTDNLDEPIDEVRAHYYLDRLEKNINHKSLSLAFEKALEKGEVLTWGKKEIDSEEFFGKKVLALIERKK